MSTQTRYLIKFQQGDLASLRARLLEDLSREQFAVLLGKAQKINGYTIITVIDLLFLEPADYAQQVQAVERGEEGMFHRSTLSLGLEVMRSIMHDQVISIVGVGGLGSIIAEHLIHMGFQTINLIDPDVLEVSNLNRVVGAYYEDAQQQRPKVEVVRKHLTSAGDCAAQSPDRRMGHLLHRDGRTCDVASL